MRDKRSVHGPPAKGTWGHHGCAVRCTTAHHTSAHRVLLMLNHARISQSKKENGKKSNKKQGDHKSNPDSPRDCSTFLYLRPERQNIHVELRTRSHRCGMSRWGRRAAWFSLAHMVCQCQNLEVERGKEMDMDERVSIRKKKHQVSGHISTIGIYNRVTGGIYHYFTKEEACTTQNGEIWNQIINSIARRKRYPKTKAMPTKCIQQSSLTKQTQTLNRLTDGPVQRQSAKFAMKLQNNMRRPWDLHMLVKAAGSIGTEFKTLLYNVHEITYNWIYTAVL